MSNLMYNKMWHQTQEALNTLLDKESQKMTEPQRNKVLVFQMLATFYIKYVQIFRNMENVYDQIVHPQKRMLIRKVLDGVMGRILELKNEMVELELTEFHYFDDILQDLKLAPQQLDVPIPRYFLKERLEVIKGREKTLARILNECGLDLPKVVWRGFHQSKKTVKEREEEMVFLGMSAGEEGSASDVTWLLAASNSLWTVRAGTSAPCQLSAGDSPAPDLMDLESPTWQLAAPETAKRKPPPLFNEVSAAIVQSEHVTRLRNEVQLKHEQSYQEALINIKEELKLMEGQDIKEHLQDQIRQWFIECSEEAYKGQKEAGKGQGTWFQQLEAKPCPQPHEWAGEWTEATAFHLPLLASSGN
ncbi:hypothetical protein U0070_007970 [Myodes glareolus]|uniref:IQ motif containing with AAA domain 1 n=1 Tax=Myodes glareolus TaxID=447135 RepID=A0AAW0IGT9_MYOGA